LDSARAYLATLPAAISGAGGHAATFAAACRLVRLGLSDSDALALLAEYNRRCQPPWTEKDLAHKLHDARRVAGCQVRTVAQPKPAVRVVWTVARKAGRVAEPVATRPTPPPAVPVATPRPAVTERPQQPRPEPAAAIPPDCLPWLRVAEQVLAGEFDGCDRSTRQSLTYGLEAVAHPDCRRALAQLKAATHE